MSKTIRLDDIVYLHLEVFRGKRETFSQVVERLLQVIARLEDISPLIYPGESHSIPSAAEIQDRYRRGVSRENPYREVKSRLATCPGGEDASHRLIQKVGEVHDDNRKL